MVFYYNAEELRFKTISEFKRSIKDGGEIVIEWDGRSYGIFFSRCGSKKKRILQYLWLCEKYRLSTKSKKMHRKIEYKMFIFSGRHFKLPHFSLMRSPSE